MASAEEIAASLRDSVKGYKVVAVSWNDSLRTTGSCYGPNITDATLRNGTTGETIVVVRPENFNEKVCPVPASQISVMGKGLKPTTLNDYLSDFKGHAEYLGGEVPEDLSLDAVDTKVLVRYQAVFVAPPDRGEYVVEHYNYQSIDADPKNALLLCTTQGTSVTKDGSGKVQLHLHNTDERTKHTMHIEPTRFGVGGPQIESQKEREAAAAAGKATSAVIGTRALGTRLNAFMVVQVPLKQKEEQLFQSKCLSATLSFDEEEEEEEDFDIFEEHTRGVKRKTGKSTAGRVSLGKTVGTVEPLPSRLERHPDQPMTATVMLFYVVEGGVPKPEDIERATSELNTLYAAGAGEGIFDAGHCTDAPPVFKKGTLPSTHNQFPTSAAVKMDVYGKLSKPDGTPMTCADLPALAEAVKNSGTFSITMS